MIGAAAATQISARRPSPAPATAPTRRRAALWLALAIGIVVALICVAAAAPIMSLLGGGSQAADLAARYLRLAAPGIPCALIALAGQGYLRGVDRLKLPLVILVVANLVNIVLELVLVYGLDLGLDGAALGTVAAQLGHGCSRSRSCCCARPRTPARPCARVPSRCAP